MRIERSHIEEFLFNEADLLDQWRLPEWLELFTDDATYEVPCTDLPADASPDTNLFYIADDRFRLGRGRDGLKTGERAAKLLLVGQHHHGRQAGQGAGHQHGIEIPAPQDEIPIGRQRL